MLYNIKIKEAVPLIHIFFFLFKIKFIRVTLVNMIIQASGVGFNVTRFVYCTVCLPPKVKSYHHILGPPFTSYPLY